MAWATDDSPISRATRKATTPAAMPTSMPRTSSCLAMVRSPPRSVAGETEKVTAVVHELVHVGSTEHGGRTLFGADEVDHQRADHEREDRPGQEFTNRDDRQRHGGGNGSVDSSLSHENEASIGITRPVRW